ncbi:nuclear membrane protein, partial [Moniliophthora roreri]
MKTVRNDREVRVNICVTEDPVYHLVSYRLHKAVDHLCDEFGADASTTNFGRVTVHTGFPKSALVYHGRYGRRTVVVFVLQRTRSNFLDDIYRNISATCG